MAQKLLQKAMHTAATTNGIGVPQTVADMKNIVVQVTLTTQFTTGLLKFQGSVNDGATPPTFSSPASKTNQWGYIQAIRLADGTVVNGAAGIDLSLAGNLGTFLFKINSDALSQFCTELSTLSGAGEITVTVSSYAEVAD